MELIITDLHFSDEERLRLLNEYFTYVFKRSWKSIVFVIIFSLIYLALGIFYSNSIVFQSTLIGFAVLFPVYFFIVRTRISAKQYFKQIKSSPRFESVSSIQMDERSIAIKINSEEGSTFIWKSITKASRF